MRRNLGELTRRGRKIGHQRLPHSPGSCISGWYSMNKSGSRNMRLVRTTFGSQQGRGRQKCSFRKAYRSRFALHLSQSQPVPESLRTCFEGPFGEVIRKTGTMSTVNPFRFSTKYQDDETDLLYYGHRYYDPSRGSWNSKDPIGEDGGNKLYNYCANDAANALDALGRWHASVHLWMTIDWSMEAGFTRPSGGDIGVADNDIDSFPTWSPPCPIGQQGRHMKQTKNGMDSRDW